jgi:hypothetical protein
MSQLQQIKSLSNELSENALFSYSKRGILILMEILGYLISIGIFIGAFIIALYVPNYKLSNHVKISVDSPKLTELLFGVGFIFILFSIISLMITLYIRRMRRKKAQVYELTQLIKNL